MAFWNLIAAYIGPLWLIVTVMALLLVVWNINLQRRLSHLDNVYQKLTTDTEGGGLGDILAIHMEHLQQALGRVDTAEETVKILQNQTSTHLQHLGIIRFNPFQSTGSDQSFSLAIADDAGNGAVITGLHSRDGARIYAKPLTAWNSTYTLTEEEQRAIRRSRGEKDES